MELHFPILLDGSTGTQLQRRGFTGDTCSEQWVLEHPQAILDTQTEYLDAGSQILYSCTFGASRVKLEEHGIFNRVDEINRKMVALSKQAADGKAYVAGDIGPIGKFLIPFGDMTFEEMYEVFLEQAKAQEEAGVDLFVVETMMSVPEARAAVLAAKAVSSKPVFCTFTCDENGKTISGSDIEAALIIMEGIGVDAFGLNCSVGPEDMQKQLLKLSRYSSVPLIAKPNAGLPEFVDGKAVYNCPPKEFTRCLPELAEAGVMIFGGCCGTVAEHIQALHDGIQNLPLKKPDPKHADKLHLATEKKVFFVDPDAKTGTVLVPDENLEEALEAAAESEETFITIQIRSDVDIENFADYQYAVCKPLCIHCEDASLLEKTLRVFQGRACYEGALSESVLLPLQKKYGLQY